MDRLKSLSGGQPLRSDDWRLIQDATASAFKSMIQGLTGSLDPVILSGLSATVVGENLVVSEGVIFDGEEICYVPAASFTYHGGSLIEGEGGGDPWLLYFEEDVTTGELRTFKDTTEKEVYEYRRYRLGYAETVPAGAIPYAGMEMLKDVLVAASLAAMPAPQADVVSYVRKSYNVSQLDQYQDIVPSPGAGKFIQVISLSARMVVTSQLDCGTQELYVFYGTHDDTPEIGSFPNSFLELPLSKNRMMDIQPGGDVYDNMAVRAKLSGGTVPSSGSAQVIFYCIYKTVTQ